MNQDDLFNQKKSFHFDDFIIKDQIGMGKFGAVYKAIEKKTQIVVAIKIIPKKTIASQILYTQLRRQIEIQSRLKHISICELYAYFHDTNNVFMVLEYCPQGSLALLSNPSFNIVKQKKQTLSDNRIASIFLQLVYGLAYMHARHVMHRDLKLQNILLDQENNIKISDFGWCVHHASSRHTFCGTMEYISPEMLNQESYEHSIDVYCLGIILYELFYFRSPFLGENQVETIKNIKQGNLIFDDEIRQVGDEAKILIRKLLDRDPLKRPKARYLFEDQFILKYHKNSSHSRRKRRLTEQTFREFKQEFFKQSQTIEQVQLAHASSQEQVDKSKDIFVILENEENQNETTLVQQLEQTKESTSVSPQVQIIQNKNESEQLQHVSQQEYHILENTEQNANKQQIKQTYTEQKLAENIQIETSVTIGQGSAQYTQNSD